jgi:5-methylcytosine-specific restriction enzyme A
MSPIKLCAEPTCPERATVRGRCATHATQARKMNRSVNDSFYSSKPWRASRKRQLHDFPLCQHRLADGTECGAVADSVHHRTPIEDGGARRDRANLMSVCRSCHAAIHRALGRAA